jgi:1,4-dihydroxy-2-naphthoyl-CoA hydrolase
VNDTPPADADSAFLRAAGFVAELVTGTRVRGHADLGPEHHTDQGVVHGGLYATLVEIAGGAGANAAVAGRGQFAVGVHNATDFLRASTGGRALVTAEALHQGRSQQLWDVVITDEASGKVLARGQLRTQNLPVPEQPGA